MLNKSKINVKEFINDLESKSIDDFKKLKKEGHYVNVFGIEYCKPYLLKYEIYDNVSYFNKKKKIENQSYGKVNKGLCCLRYGKQIISDHIQSLEFFKSIYDGPKEGVFFYHRHFVKDFVVMFSTLHILGDNPKVKRKLRETFGKQKFKDYLWIMKKNRGLINQCFCSYMFINFMDTNKKNCEKTEKSKQNTVTISDYQKMSEESSDDFFSNSKFTSTYSELGFGSKEELQKSLVQNGFLQKEHSISDLRNIISI